MAPPHRSILLSPVKLSSLTLHNRVVVSPMCMYSAQGGLANEFHLVHLSRFALGGAGLILSEATAVTPEGRISSADLGLWTDAQIAPLARIVDFIHEHGSLIGVQLAHAGRKASTAVPWQGHGAVAPGAGGWAVVGPSETPYSSDYPLPRAMSTQDIAEVVQVFGASTRRAANAGFDAVEIHAAHGYLLHQFLSPLSNARTDEYGGSFENRARLTLEVTRAVREVWPAHLPLLVRISASDWVPGGWNIEESVQLAQLLSREGVQVLDVSSGGLSPEQQISVGPGYQVHFAERLKQDSDLMIMTVGMIESPAQAEAILQAAQADLVALAREFLRDPQFVQRAAREFGEAVEYPAQYQRAAPRV